MDVRPFNINPSENCDCMMKDGVNDYTTMQRLAFNNYVKFNIEIFRVTVNSMVTESFREVLDKPSIHLIHNMWTRED